jgi:riboflavin biosynthesis pyrimidine reductase
MADAVVELVSSLHSSSTSRTPVVCLSYAQSIDGSISDERGRMIALSDPESMRMVHSLRAAHDAIVVGVGTVVQDNPSLTVRLVEGESPLPVVLDPRLRTPLSSKLVTSEACRRPAIVTLPLSHACACPAAAVAEDSGACAACRARSLLRAGCRVVEVPLAEGNERWDLREVFQLLSRELGVRTVMVEGGSSVIQQMVTQGAADVCVITVAPVFVGGTRVCSSPTASRGDDYHADASKPRPRTDFPILGGLTDFAPVVTTLGTDLVLCGRLHVR